MCIAADRGNKSERFNEGLLHVRVECLISVMSEQYNQVVCNVKTHGYWVASQNFSAVTRT